MGQCGSFSELWVTVGHCGSGGSSSMKSRKCGSFSELWVIVGHCGSFRELWVIVGQEVIVLRKEGSVGLLVNCGSVWVIVGHCGSGGYV